MVLFNDNQIQYRLNKARIETTSPRDSIWAVSYTHLDVYKRQARLFAAFVDVQERLPWAVQAVVLALVGGFILKMGPDGVMPFIYFQF